MENQERSENMRALDRILAGMGAAMLAVNGINGIAGAISEGQNLNLYEVGGVALGAYLLTACGLSALRK